MIVKKALVLGLIFAVTFAAACSKKTGETGNSQTAAETAAASESETTAEVPETPEEAGESSSDGEGMVLVTVNTDGLGEIALSETGEKPEFDEEFPMSSAFTHVAKGKTIALSARGQEDYQLVKWMQDGAYYSAEADITPAVEADTEFVAVFLMSTGYEGPAAENMADAKTMGDVLALPHYEIATGEKYFAYIFEHDNTMYRAVSFITPEIFDQLFDLDFDDPEYNKKYNAIRAVSFITPEIFDQLFDLDFDDPEYNKKYNAIAAPLPIDRMDNLTEMIPAQEELDKYVGKTAGDLIDEGWSYSSYNLEDMAFDMYHGLFMYTVILDGTIENSEESLTGQSKTVKSWMRQISGRCLLNPSPGPVLETAHRTWSRKRQQNR